MRGAEQGVRLAGVYAESLLALAEEQGAAEALLAELDELQAYAGGHADFAAFLASPAVDAEARRDVLEKLFRRRLSDLALDALQIVNRKGRLSLLPAIVAAYRAALDERRGRLEVRVVSAVPLTEDQRRRLTAAVARHTGREARLREEVDPALLGGVVLRIGDRKVDSSVATRLATLAEALAARASQEIWSGRQYAAE